MLGRRGAGSGQNTQNISTRGQEQNYDCHLSNHCLIVLIARRTATKEAGFTGYSNAASGSASWDANNAWNLGQSTSRWVSQHARQATEEIANLPQVLKANHWSNADGSKRRPAWVASHAHGNACSCEGSCPRAGRTTTLRYLRKEAFLLGNESSSSADGSQSSMANRLMCFRTLEIQDPCAVMSRMAALVWSNSGASLRMDWYRAMPCDKDCRHSSFQPRSTRSLPSICGSSLKWKRQEPHSTATAHRRWMARSRVSALGSCTARGAWYWDVAGASFR